MAERGPSFGLRVWALRRCVLHLCELRLCELRLCRLRSLAWVVVAAGAACMGAAPSVAACTLNPHRPEPHGRHWYYKLNSNQHRCWFLGPAGLAVKTSAHAYRVAAAQARPAAPESAAAAPSATPPAPQAAAAEPADAPVGADSAEATAPAAPPPAAAELWQRSLAAEPVQPSTTGETRSVEAIAPAPAPLPAPAAEPAETPQPAAPVWPAPATRVGDHTFALIMLAVALLMIAGLMFWAIRRQSGRKARAQMPSASAVGPAPMGAPTPLVSARTVVRQRRPSRAREHATDEIGTP